MLQEEPISIRPNLPCASSPIFLNGAARKCRNGIPFPFPVIISAKQAARPCRKSLLHLSNGKAYVKAALEKGLDINVFGKRLSFFFNAHNNLFEEVAKFRAARRMWAKMMKELGATDPKAMMLRFHTQTGGSTLTAQQPLIIFHELPFKHWQRCWVAHNHCIPTDMMKH